jgi:glycosyltransferase involved in cell wall biosynthesis
VYPGKRRAAALLVANPRTRTALPRGAAANVIQFIENGVDLSIWSEVGRPEQPRDAVTRFIFIGRLVDWKAVDLLLLAFRKAAASAAISLTVVGDGPERQRLEQLARSTDTPGAEGNEAGRVSFLGWRTQAECARLLQGADAMVLPSLWECGGAVVLEAMSMSVPVIATGWGGPADYLDDECGVLVKPDSREGFVDGLAAAMVTLARSPELRLAMGRAGRRKVVAEFDWDVKVERMLAVYRAVTDSSVARRKSGGTGPTAGVGSA